MTEESSSTFEQHVMQQTEGTTVDSNETRNQFLDELWGASDDWDSHTEGSENLSDSYTDEEATIFVEDITPPEESPQRAAEEFMKTLIYSDFLNSLDEDRAEAIYKAVPTAQKLMAKLKLNDEMYNPTNSRAWEKGTLLLALASKWQSNPKLSDRKVIARQLALLYLPQDRGYHLAHANSTDAVGTPGSTIQEIIREAWPESNGDIEWVKAHVAHGNVVVLPYHESSPTARGKPSELLKRVYDRLQVPTQLRKEFNAVASRTLGLMFVWESTSERDKVHEMEHLKYPGLRVGLLGTALNEGVTEWRTLRKVGTPITRSTNEFGLLEITGYNSEIYFLLQLYRKYPHIHDLLERRYENDSLEQTRTTAIGLINQMGLDGFLTLYRMLPNARKLGTENKAGFLDPEEVVRTL